MNSSRGNCYRNLILSGETPLLIHESLNWDCLKWTLEVWSSVFRDELLRFRCGKKQCQKLPVWEGQCESISTTFDEFIRFCNEETVTQKEWRYFDYKHMTECFSAASDNPFQSLVWESVGFPEKGAESSTLWIGSSGAHTPCHVDTYGCNIVAQVYGRKRWILFPFSEITNLQPTRVPYEESSIYSNINFSCSKNLEGINFSHCYTVDLSPGDILFVPPKWWHYVENLTTAISINMWIPRADDDLWRVREGLVRYFISSVVNDISTEARKRILNPNENAFEASSELRGILDFCKEREKENSSEQMHEDQIQEDCVQDYTNRAHEHKYTVIQRTNDLKARETEKHQSNCTASVIEKEMSTIDREVKSLTTVINAFCHPDVIREVQNKFINS